MTHLSTSPFFAGICLKLLLLKSRVGSAVVGSPEAKMVVKKSLQPPALKIFISEPTFVGSILSTNAKLRPGWLRDFLGGTQPSNIPSVHSRCKMSQFCERLRATLLDVVFIIPPARAPEHVILYFPINVVTSLFYPCGQSPSGLLHNCCVSQWLWGGTIAQASLDEYIFKQCLLSIVLCGLFSSDITPPLQCTGQIMKLECWHYRKKIPFLVSRSEA